MNTQRPIDRPAMEKVVAGLTTKSEKIRALGAAGYPRTDIARFLDIRYQHVRNVLVQAGESSPPYEEGQLPLGVWVTVGPDGRLVLPVGYRRFLGIESGGPVFIEREKESLRMKSRTTALAEAQGLVARHAVGTGSMVDELLFERRAEALRDARKND